MRMGGLRVARPARCWGSVGEIEKAGECLAVVRYDEQTDHWVAVLEISAQQVVLGDPICGRRVMKRQQFAERWTGEVLRIHFPEKSGSSL